MEITILGCKSKISSITKMPLVIKCNNFKIQKELIKIKKTRCKINKMYVKIQKFNKSSISLKSKNIYKLSKIPFSIRYDSILKYAKNSELKKDYILNDIHSFYNISKILLNNYINQSDKYILLNMENTFEIIKKIEEENITIEKIARINMEKFFTKEFVEKLMYWR